MNKLEYIPEDLVKSDNNTKILLKVRDLTKGKRGDVLYRLVAAEDNDVVIYLSEHQITPIPLTPDILEKNGWKRNGGQYSFTYKPYAGDKVELIGFFIEMFKDVHDILKHRYFQITHEDKIVCGCFYIHQLQHLLFGLGLNHEMKVY